MRGTYLRYTHQIQFSIDRLISRIEWVVVKEEEQDKRKLQAEVVLDRGISDIRINLIHAVCRRAKKRRGRGMGRMETMKIYVKETPSNCNVRTPTNYETHASMLCIGQTFSLAILAGSGGG